MTPARIHGIDVARVEEAVRAAERLTSGEIRVAVARFYFWGNVRRAAERAFVRLEMARTRERNGVLILVAPRRRQLAVIGDEGICARVPPAFWAEVAGALAADFRRGDATEALIRGIAAVGAALAAAFPFDPARDTNQLSDAVALPGKNVRERR